MNLRINTRTFRESDLEKMKAWVFDPEIKKNFRFTAHVKGDDVLKKFIRNQIDRKPADGFINLVLFDKSDPKKTYIGSVGLKNIDLENQNAELTIVIGDKNYRGRGFGQEALFIICKYGFKKLKLHKIFLHVTSHNKPAIKAYEKFGFVHEGTKRDHILQNKTYFDELVMSIMVDEFNNKYEK